MREIKFRVWNPRGKCWIEWGSVERWWDEYEHTLRIDEEGSDLVYEQYTGLKDKNGKEIYEGDIVCFGNVHYPMLAVWYKTAFRLKNNVGIGCPIAELELCEIIGNIHENPELLIPCNSTELGEIK